MKNSLRVKGMAGILGKIVGLDSIREDMKKRVDEILKAGNEWNKTAERLTQALEKLSETKEMDPIKGDLKRLAKQTGKLARAFEAHRQTLANLTEKI